MKGPNQKLLNELIGAVEDGYNAMANTDENAYFTYLAPFSAGINTIDNSASVKFFNTKGDKVGLQSSYGGCINRIELKLGKKLYVAQAIKGKWHKFVIER